MLRFLVRGDCFVIQKLIKNDPISNMCIIYRLIRLLENAHGTLRSGHHSARILGIKISELRES